MHIETQLPHGNGMHLIRVLDGLACAMPPNATVLAQTPAEALMVLAKWLNMAVPRGEASYPWAGKSLLCPIGSNFTVARSERGNGSAEGFLIVMHIGQGTLTQLAAWQPMGVMTHAHAWMTAVAFQEQRHLHAMRVHEEDLDPEAADTFRVRVVMTSLLMGDSEPPPNPAAPWTLISTSPPMRIGLLNDALVEHVRGALNPGETEAYFLARLQRAMLEIAQRIEVDEE